MTAYDPLRTGCRQPVLESDALCVPLLLPSLEILCDTLLLLEVQASHGHQKNVMPPRKSHVVVPCAPDVPSGQETPPSCTDIPQEASKGLVLRGQNWSRRVAGNCLMPSCCAGAWSQHHHCHSYHAVCASFERQKAVAAAEQQRPL